MELSRAHPEPYQVLVRSRRDLADVEIQDLWPTCSYCGSLSIDAFLDALETPGTEYSGSDWKYGWPHKFYVDVPCPAYEMCDTATYADNTKIQGTPSTRTRRHHKFYSTHARGATAAQEERWAKVATPLLGVELKNEDGQLRWRARQDWQSSGRVL